MALARQLAAPEQAHCLGGHPWRDDILGSLHATVHFSLLAKPLHGITRWPRRQVLLICSRSAITAALSLSVLRHTLGSALLLLLRLLL